MIDLYYCLTLTFCDIAMDGDDFSFVISLHPVLVQSLSLVDHHLDELPAGEGRWIKFMRSIDVMSGGAIVSHAGL